ncbi:MAG TPA: ATPase, T2SS/T4P/T4SS family, partial [Polyangiaceae bacterium]|nr:ATPase, T2SS/T4P/T4SS family [Polyangiaceae bacterium]
MKTIHQMLRELARADVAEFALASDRLPCVKVGGSYEPIDETTRSTSAILEMLVAAGGRSYVDELEATPAQWTTRVEGVGTIGVTAVMRAGRLQARFTVVRRASLPPPIEVDSPRAGLDRAAPAPPGLDHEPLPRSAVVQPLSGATVGTPSSLDGLLALARQEGASDLHVVAGRPPLLRIGGELLARGPPIDQAAVETMVATLVPERARATLAAQGSCDFAISRDTGRFRVNVARQRTGLKACFRCIAAAVPTLASLGLPADIERATHHHQGLVLVTGPTGHGKTSTLAAIVDIINAGTTHHVITVEDPVEYVHPRKKAMISQREVGTHTRSFQSALKASLREDPDVIVVGELRDTETVRMALAASETGHLVLGTMNTPSAA